MKQWLFRRKLGNWMKEKLEKRKGNETLMNARGRKKEMEKKMMQGLLKKQKRKMDDKMKNEKKEWRIDEYKRKKEK